MRYTLFCLLLVLVACGQPSRSLSAIFTQDSGYLRKKEMLPFLMAHQVGTYSDKNWELLQDTDIVCKYYRQADGHFVACLNDVGEAGNTCLLMEVNGDGEILRQARYSHWLRSCCLGKEIGLIKSGEDYILKMCGTGSTYCSSNIYCFRTVTPQDSLNYVVSGYWNGYLGGKGITRNITSHWQINGDSLLLEYTLKDFKSADTLLVPLDSFMCNVTFLKDGRYWRATDSTMLKEYGLY